MKHLIPTYGEALTLMIGYGLGGLAMTVNSIALDNQSLTTEQLETYCFGLGAKEFFANGNVIKNNVYLKCLDEFNL